MEYYITIQVSSLCTLQCRSVLTICGSGEEASRLHTHRMPCDFIQAKTKIFHLGLLSLKLNYKQKERGNLGPLGVQRMFYFIT